MKDFQANILPAGERRQHAGPSGAILGMEVGLSGGTSLYVGEVARETLIEAGIGEDMAGTRGGWWIALVDGSGFRVIGFTARADEGDEPRELIEAVSAAILGQGGAA